MKYYKLFLLLIFILFIGLVSADWVKSFFIPYGNMFMDDNSSIVTLTNADTYYPITANLSDGFNNGFVFQNKSFLNTTIQGWYIVSFSISGSSSVSDTDIEGVVMVNNIGLGRTGSLNRFKESGVNYFVSGNGVIYLNKGDIIRFGLERENGVLAIINVNHATMTLTKVNN